jgi:hypothetical protein
VNFKIAVGLLVFVHVTNCSIEYDKDSCDAHLLYGNARRNASEKCKKCTGVLHNSCSTCFSMSMPIDHYKIRQEEDVEISNLLHNFLTSKRSVGLGIVS